MWSVDKKKTQPQIFRGTSTDFHISCKIVDIDMIADTFKSDVSVTATVASYRNVNINRGKHLILNLNSNQSNNLWN